MLPTDCDLVFAEVVSTPGQKKIEVGLRAVAPRM